MDLSFHCQKKTDVKFDPREDQPKSLKVSARKLKLSKSNFTKCWFFGCVYPKKYKNPACGFFKR